MVENYLPWAKAMHTILNDAIAFANKAHDARDVGILIETRMREIPGEIMKGRTVLSKKGSEGKND